MSAKNLQAGVTIAILAAGKAERFGGGKLDAELGSWPLGNYALDAALDCELGRPLIVAGDPPPLFASEADRRWRARLAINPHPDKGLASSVAIAAHAALEAGSEFLLLMLADMPHVSTATLLELVEAAGPKKPAAVLHEAGHPGIPACFPRDYFDALRQLDGDKGAAELLRRAKHLALIHVPHSELADVDTEEDLAALRAQHRL
jgi:molybdenum cofactor cytidylyltransferase